MITPPLLVLDHVPAHRLAELVPKQSCIASGMAWVYGLASKPLTTSTITICKSKMYGAGKYFSQIVKIFQWQEQKDEICLFSNY